MSGEFLEKTRRTMTVNGTSLEPEEIVNDGVHPVTIETTIHYRQVIDDPVMRDL